MESTDNTQHFYKSNTGFDLPVLRSTSSSSSHLFPKCFIFVRFFFFPPPFSRAILKENENKQRVKREVNENGGKISLHAVFHPTNCRAQHNQRDCLQPPGCRLLVPGDEPFSFPCIASAQYRGLFKRGDDTPTVCSSLPFTPQGPTKNNEKCSVCL